jgi:transcription termination factor Rho
MTVLARSELEASPLADLHAIANQVGLEGFRRLRKAELIDAILGETVSSAEADAPEEERDGAESASRTRRRRPARSRRAPEDEARDASDDADVDVDEAGTAEDGDAGTGAPARRGRRRGSRGGSASADAPARGSSRDGSPAAEPSSRSGARGDRDSEGAQDAGRIAAGVVEVLGNGSAFLRVDPPEPSDEDVYISAAQVRRCELVSGDRVTGPVRTPRRSERYPSLVRIDTINGASADSVSDGVRYDELPVDWPRERLALG